MFRPSLPKSFTKTLGFGFIQLFAFGLNFHLKGHAKTFFEFTKTKLISFPLTNFIRVKYLNEELVF